MTRSRRMGLPGRGLGRTNASRTTAGATSRADEWVRRGQVPNGPSVPSNKTLAAELRTRAGIYIEALESDRFGRLCAPRVPSHSGEELLAADDQQAHRAHRGHARGARQVAQQRDLAEEFARVLAAAECPVDLHLDLAVRD